MARAAVLGDELLGHAPRLVRSVAPAVLARQRKASLARTQGALVWSRPQAQPRTPRDDVFAAARSGRRRGRPHYATRMDRPLPVRDLDWDAERAKAFADEIVGVWIELLESLHDGPVVPPALTQETVRDAVALDVPDEPMAADELVAHLREAVLDYSLKSGHPAHLAYITGAGTVPGAAADLLASGLNANVGGWLLSPAATEIELQLTRWFVPAPRPAGDGRRDDRRRRRVANFIALKAARDTMAGLETRQRGRRERGFGRLYAGARPRHHRPRRGHARARHGLGPSLPVTTDSGSGGRVARRM